MSLLINGMDMPEHGIHHGAIVITETGNRLIVNGKPYNKCFSISEIPTPHGRLIDREKVKELLLDLWKTGKNYTIADIIREIVDIPTIIEAEE